MSTVKVQRQTYTVDEVATILGTSPRTVRKNVEMGRLPGARLEGEVQGVYVIPMAAVQAFLKTGRLPEDTEEPGTPG